MICSTYVIIGGGIAGVTCAEGLNILDPHATTILISPTPSVKAVTNVSFLSKTCTQFDVEEKTCNSLGLQSVEFLQDLVVSIDSENCSVNLKSGKSIKYDKLCICSGARPKLIFKNDFVVGLRDTDSVDYLKNKVSSSRRIAIIGNGGIATELVNGLTGVEIIWAIRDKHISATFIDPGAAEFFLSRSLEKASKEEEKVVKRKMYTVDGDSEAALGPDWDKNVHFQGLLKEKKVSIEYECEVKEIKDGDGDWNVKVILTNGKVYDCDLVISATGVIPCTSFLPENIKLSSDGGIVVDSELRTTIPNIYAAGDVGSTSWEPAQHWLQMRLWTQARQMGSFAAKSMYWSRNNFQVIQDFCFEIFTHVTKFFGFKVVLLGLFNGQRLDNKYEILLRVTKNEEYVKLIMKDGRIQGAVLIGDTDLEEMCENLILNQLDVSSLGEDLLNPDIDIDDYFD